MQVPDNASFMIVAYVATVVELLGYAALLLHRTRRAHRDVAE